MQHFPLCTLWVLWQYTCCAAEVYPMLKVWHVRLNTRLFRFAKDQGTRFGKHTTKSFEISPRKDNKTKLRGTCLWTPLGRKALDLTCSLPTLSSGTNYFYITSRPAFVISGRWSCSCIASFPGPFENRSLGTRVLHVMHTCLLPCCFPNMEVEVCVQVWV